MKQLMEKLREETVRIQRIILLGGATTDGAFSDDLNEFLDDEDEKTIEACLGKIPDYVDIEAHGYARNDSISEWLYDAGKLGFLVQFATPVMEPTGENSRSFSWGHYSIKWIYAETLDAAIDSGLKWVKGCRRTEDRKAKAKKSGAA